MKNKLFVRNIEDKRPTQLNNVACPYCSKIIGVKSIKPMICEHCGSSFKALVFMGMFKGNVGERNQYLVLGEEEFKAIKELK